MFYVFSQTADKVFGTESTELVNQATAFPSLIVTQDVLEGKEVIYDDVALSEFLFTP